MAVTEAAEAVAVSRKGEGAKRGGKYLTFRLGEEEYGLEILKVREIIGLMDITHIPRTPNFVKGVINLRGKVIPVIETRIKFGMEKIETTAETCIIVVEAHRATEALEMGILVDAVSEVLDIQGSEIEDTPEFGSQLDTQFILGMAKAKGRVIILLDIDRVLTDKEIIAVTKVNK
jgi:purine-binding chemotaxis protein CheW